MVGSEGGGEDGGPYCSLEAFWEIYGSTFVFHNNRGAGFGVAKVLQVHMTVLSHVTFECPARTFI